MGVDQGVRAPRRAGWLRAAIVAIVPLVLVLGAVPPDGRAPTAGAQTATPPNIVVVLTDDQRADSLRVMPRVQSTLVPRGITMRAAIASNPLCCPSRASILTGRYSHTTGVWANGGLHGGWEAFKPWESDTIATALDSIGYRTGLIGKYLNNYRGDGIYVPPGWDRWFAFANDNGLYYGYTMLDETRGEVPFGTASSDYSTDVIRRAAVRFIRNTPADTPLFLLVAPFAPHGPATAAPRHERDLAEARVRLGPAVNEADVSDKPAYVQERPIWNPAAVRRVTRNQWESLLAVDDLVGSVWEVLEETRRADDTFFLFTSDNGFANREHRWHGKLVPYEESIRVPMVAAFPGRIPAGTVSGALVSNVDIAPTILDVAGASLPTEGRSMVPVLTDVASSVRDAVVLENLGVGNPPYCGVRTRAFTYARYATGEEELYDLVQDRWQLQNVAAARPNKAAELRALAKELCDPPPPGFSWAP
jgi:N-acetylglucosamine-6-sulfatase